MRKKALRQDFFMEIKNSLGRFLSILFIVALGVAFFSGIRSSQPDMLLTGDAYFNKLNLMDIKVVSTLGVTKEDIQAIEKIDGVKTAEGGYSTDGIFKEEKNQNVIHVMSFQKELNKAELTKGRMPRKKNECLADDESGYKVGDIIQLESGNNQSLADVLDVQKFKVVGTGSSPCYISFGRGNSQIGNGNIKSFIIVPQESFSMDVYSEVYVTIDKKGISSFSKEYEEKVNTVTEKIKDIAEERGNIRIEKIKNDAFNEIGQAENELNEKESEAVTKLNDAKEQIQDAQKQIDHAKNEVNSGAGQLENGRNELNKQQGMLADAKNQYVNGQQQLNEGIKEYNDKVAEYQAGIDAYESARLEFNEKIQQYTAAWNQIEEGINLLNQQREVLVQEYEIVKDSEAPEDRMKAETLLQKIGEIDSQLSSLSEQSQLLSEQGNALEEGSIQFEQKRLALEAVGQKLAEAGAEIEKNRNSLEEAGQKIEEGEAQIYEGKNQLDQSGKDLENAKQEIFINEQKLSDANAEYESNRLDAESQISDGREEIEKSRQKIEEIEAPSWYISDRESLPEYSGYQENADRMKAIGQVFPVLFFLVAALISLTSMTRMVEEQRTQIGTLKALGYDKFSIASKYLGYALAACVTGSIIGILVGEKIIPYIIIYAYGIMYHHINDILIPYNMFYAIMSMATAVLCTLAATLISCYKELSSQPAVLMRPPAPKKGKRVFMEKVTPLWKHLSFIWKSTIRNLFRYKKRFFMTVFGIGGCMALILVGFGLKDSIFEIADVQYKEIQTYEGIVFLDDENKEAVSQFHDFMNKEHDIEGFTDVRMTTSTLNNQGKNWEVTQVVTEQPQELEKFVKFRDRISKEKYSLDNKGIVLNEKSAKMLGLKVGDKVKIKTDHEEKEVKISHICENYMGHFMYMTKDLYEKLYGEEFKENTSYFKVKGDSRKLLEEEGEKIIAKDGVLGIQYLHDIEKRLNEMLKSLNLVIMVLIVSAGMLNFVVLYNLNNINITERRRELATLKVLGFYDMEVGKYVYRENIVLTFIGSMAGVILGIVLHRFIIQTVEIDSVMFGRVIDFSSFVISIAFTFGFSAFVNWVMYFKLKKIDMVESLKSIE